MAKFICYDCLKEVPGMGACPHCNSVRTGLLSVAMEALGTELVKKPCLSCGKETEGLEAYPVRAEVNGRWGSHNTCSLECLNKWRIENGLEAFKQ